MRDAYAFAGLAVAAGALIALRQGGALPATAGWGGWGDYLAPEEGAPPDESKDQETTTLEDIAVTFDPSTYWPAAVTIDMATQNEKAFLDMIAYAEGVRPGADGYRTLFGGGLVDTLDDHPRRFFSFTNKRGETLKTSAAGRYQFLSRTWDALARKLGLSDFGPDSQDRAALELVRQRGALADVQAGRVEAAIAKCAPIWASLPGAGYAQPERKLSNLLAQFNAAGGTQNA